MSKVKLGRTIRKDKPPNSRNTPVGYKPREEAAPEET